jgi:hypothetical protein
VTLELRIGEGRLAAILGPFDSDLGAELASEPGEQLSLRRLLDAVVDAYDVARRDDATWIELRKSFRNGS